MSDADLARKLAERILATRNLDAKALSELRDHAHRVIATLDTNAEEKLAYARMRSAESRRARAIERRDEIVPIIRRMRGEGASFTTIAEYLDEHGFKPKRAAKWNASSVRYLLIELPGEDRA